MLRFAVRHLRWLAHVPLLPQLFDAWLLVWTAAFHRATFHAIESLEMSVLEWPGVTPSRHRYGGFGFTRAGREFAHVHGNGLLDVKLTRALAGEIVAAERAEPHHVFGLSAWVSFQLRTVDDCAPALGLLRLAASSDTPDRCQGEP